MAAPNFQTITGQQTYVPPPSSGTMSALMAMGKKAAVPGGVNAPNTNTIAPKYTAPPTQQTVTTPQNTSVRQPDGSYTLSAPGTTPPAPATPTPPATGTTGAAAPTFPGAVGSLMKTAQGNVPIGQSAADIGAKYAAFALPALAQAQGEEKGLSTTGTFPVGEGNASAIASATGQYLSGLSQEEQQQLAANSNQLTAQQQAQQGIGTAAGLIKPSQAQFGQTVFNPATSQYEGSGGLPPDVMAQYAQMAASGQYAAIPSSITSNSVLSAQLNAAAKQINPAYNPIASTAQGAAAASNIQTSGTAATDAAAQGLKQATPNYVNANTAYITAQNQAANLQQVLSSTGINQSPQFVNQKINSLQNQLGSANYTSFITALTELQQKYTNLLSTVGAQTPTVNGVQATTILNPDSTPAQINAAIDALNNAAYAQLKPLYDQIGTYQGQLGGSQTSNAQSTTANPWH